MVRRNDRLKFTVGDGPRGLGTGDPRETRSTGIRYGINQERSYTLFQRSKVKVVNSLLNGTEDKVERIYN